MNTAQLRTTDTTLPSVLATRTGTESRRVARARGVGEDGTVEGVWLTWRAGTAGRPDRAGTRAAAAGRVRGRPGA